MSCYDQQGKVKKIFGKLHIELPENVCADLGIEEGAMVSVEIYDRRSFMVDLNVSRKTVVKRKCEICLQKDSEHECQLCGRRVCISCYWAMGGICKDCVGK